MQWFKPRTLGVKRFAAGISSISLMVFSAGPVHAGAPGAAGDLYVTDAGNSRIVQIDSGTGAVVGDFASTGMIFPIEARFGPDGNLFVVNDAADNATEYDGNTGGFLRVFAGDQMSFPEGLTFAADGTMLVYNAEFNNITEYDSSGAFIGWFAPGIPIPAAAAPLDFGPDGNLYVSFFLNDTIERFAPDGTDLGPFAAGGGLSGPEQHAFGPDGNLYVASFSSNSVIEYDGATGAPVGPFIATHLSGPAGIAFGPDGNVWVANEIGSDVNEFDGVTGAWIRQVTGFNHPFGLTVKPAPASCLKMSVSPLTAGQDATWNIIGATPGSLLAVAYGFQPGTTVLSGQYGFCATLNIQGVDRGRLVGTAVADSAGHASIGMRIPGNAAGVTVLTQAAEQGTCPQECVSSVDTQTIR